MQSENEGSFERRSLNHHSVVAHGRRALRVQAGRPGGHAVILLHGRPQTSWAWRRTVPPLAAHRRVIPPDLPGFGTSSKPDIGYDKKIVARRRRSFVHAVGLSRIVLVGHDMGGQVAYVYAAHWPDEVSHPVFTEGGLPGFGQEVAMDVSKLPMHAPTPWPAGLQLG